MSADRPTREQALAAPSPPPSRTAVVNKHTPGPLAVIEGPHSLHIAEYLPDGRVCGVPLRIGGTALSFRAPHSGARRGESPRWYRFSETDHANVRLFAVAAELLAAAQAAQCDCSVAERHSGHRVECWMPALSAAIAKASA